MKKYSVLMYNFNNYEIMREPKEVDPECEYIYVTDNPKYQNETKVWKVIVDKDLEWLSAFDKCYSVRFNLFKYATTPVCIYLDGSVQIYKKLTKLYNDFTNRVLWTIFIIVYKDIQEGMRYIHPFLTAELF